VWAHQPGAQPRRHQRKQRTDCEGQPIPAVERHCLRRTRGLQGFGARCYVTRSESQDGTGVQVTMERPILEFYTQPSAMTSAGRYASLFDELPNNVSELVRIIQHLVVYDVVAPDFYSVTIPDKRQTEIHIRSIEKMLDGIFALDDRPLSVVRSMDKRLAGRCHHFMLFLVAILRAKSIPSRARCGFGSYFNPPYFEDHWVCEYWNACEARWVLVDAQFDDVWCAKLKIDHDILDVPGDRFLVAGDAWVRCRKGETDPAKFSCLQ
jgi:hypothetical protein